MRCSSSSASLSAMRLTGPMPSRSRIRRSKRDSASPVVGIGSSAPIAAAARIASGAQSRRSAMRRISSSRVCAACSTPAWHRTRSSRAVPSDDFGGLRRLLRLGERGFAARQRVAGGGALCRRCRDGLDQRRALGCDLGGQQRQPLDLGGEAGVTLGERVALALRGIDAVLPGPLLERDRGETLAPRGGLAEQPVDLALRQEMGGAALGERGALARELGAGARRVGKLGKRGARGVALRRPPRRDRRRRAPRSRPGRRGATGPSPRAGSGRCGDRARRRARRAPRASPAARRDRLPMPPASRRRLPSAPSAVSRIRPRPLRHRRRARRAGCAASGAAPRRWARRRRR